MKVCWGKIRDVRDNRSLAEGNDEKKHILLFLILMLSIFMLFNLYFRFLREQERKDAEHGSVHMTAVQVIFHRMARGSGIMFDTEDEQQSIRQESCNKLMWPAAFWMWSMTLCTCYGIYKIKWLKNLFVIDLLQKVIDYIYQSDGKKRRNMCLPAV